VPQHLDSNAPGGAPIRVGLIGFGVAGSVFHAPLIASTSGLQLAKVVTASPERAEQARGRYPEVTVVASAEALWEQAGSLDLVVVAAPNDTHVPLAHAALAAGLPVVVDKPLCATVEEGHRLIEDARRRRLLLTVFQNRRWDGDFLTLQQLLAEGALGQVWRFESRFERWRPVPKPGWRQRGGSGEAGGLLYDLGSHLIDQALVLFGPVRQVYAELERRYPGAQVDDDSFVALTHCSGLRSHLWMSALAAQLGPRLRVLGSTGGYTKYGLDPQEDALRAGGRPDQPSWGVEPAERWGMLGSGDDLRPLPTLAGAYPRFYEGVVAALRGAASPPVAAADSLAVLEVIEAARRSAASGQTVTLGAA